MIATNSDLFLGSNEHSVAPWETAFLALDYLADVLYFDKLYPKLNEYLSQLVKPLFGDLGWTGTANDSMDTLKLRTIILKKNCVYGTASSHAGKLLLDWKVILLKKRYFSLFLLKKMQEFCPPQAIPARLKNLVKLYHLAQKLLLRTLIPVKKLVLLIFF